MKKTRVLLLLTFLAIGVAIRFSITYKDSPDCVYHLRRAQFVLQHFPKTIIFDPLMNFPDGGVCIWPPLFDVSLAIPALVIGQLQTSALYVPLIYGAIAILGAGLAGMAVRPRWGILAALFVAICPGHLQYSQFGHTDQHVAESCWGFLLLASFLLYSRRKSMKFLIATGFFLACAVLNWQGAIFWAPLLAVPMFFDPKSTAVKAFCVLGIPTILVSFATLYWLSGFEVPFSYISFGWFQPVFLSACFAFVLLRCLIRSRSIPVTLLFLASILPLLFFAKQFIPLLFSGVEHLFSQSKGVDTLHGYLSYPKEWLSQIIEYRPLFADSWTWPLGFLSPAFYLSPWPIFVWGRRAWQKQNMLRNLTLFSWGLFIFVFTCMQRRNVYYASLLGAISALEIAAVIGVWLHQRKKIVPAIYALLMFPMFFGYNTEVRSGYAASPDRLEAMEQIKKITPQEINAYDPRFLQAGETIPELQNVHSIMAFWSQGHLVTYFAERPVVANNFGYGFFDCLHFYFAESESDAMEILKKHRVKYVLSMDLLPVMNQYGAVLGHSDYLTWQDQKWSATARYFRTIQSRLCDFGGDGLKHFRLLWSSKEGMQRFGRFVPRWRIYEIVEKQ
ncbi:MAG: hypothetical protein C5B54_07735 [Acidobacteria bacterium]|nr:MAG: hypothetical protein C5B54_07735 [Acidobacteriota bacterium]